MRPRSTVTNLLRRRSTGWALAAATAAAAVAWGWWASDSAPYPYSQRWLLDLPLPLLSQRRLERLLEPAPGERVLEIGPGTGLQSLPVAARLGDSGRLDIVDVQQRMLDHVMSRAAQCSLANIVPTNADAQALPFPAGTFDAAYLVTALGEIPAPDRTLREVRRVLKFDGRLVVGEFFDRHQVRRHTLSRHAQTAGLRVTQSIGPPFAYYARLVPAPTAR